MFTPQTVMIQLRKVRGKAGEVRSDLVLLFFKTVQCHQCEQWFKVPSKKFMELHEWGCAIAQKEMRGQCIFLNFYPNLSHSFNSLHY